jgi:hypothetical protein
MLSIFFQDPPSSPGSIFLVALVPIKLLLKIGLGILDAHQGTQGSLECLTTHRADSDGWNASEILYDPKSAFCHVHRLPRVAVPV